MTARTLVLDVGAVAHGGHCVARTDAGQVVFVRHTLPGERVRAVVTEERKGYLRADAVEVLTASADRVVPACRWAGPDRCGGCDFQHATPAAQRELKAAVIREQLLRLAGLSASEVDALEVRVDPLPLVEGQSEGLGWRTRMKYTVDAGGRAGLRKHRSREMVPIDQCLIAHAGVRAVPVLERSWPRADSVEVVAPARGDAAVLVTRGRRGPTLVRGPARVRERAVGRDWSIPAEAFWQVHPYAAETLAATVLDLLDPRPGEHAWDLYGGAGLFAAALAPRLGGDGQVVVVESDHRAAGAARRCLRELTTVSVVESHVEHALARLGRADLVVLDPPRAGAGHDVVAAVAAAAPRAVTYVACDPAALARDVRTFRDAGWRLAALRAFDLFPMTHHAECVALVTRL